MLALQDLQSSDSASDTDSNSFRATAGYLQPRLLDRHITGGDGKLHKARHALHVLAIEVLPRIETLDLGGDLGGEILRVKLRDAAASRLASEYSVPRCFGGKTQTAKQTHTGDHYTAQLDHTAARVSVAVPIPVAGVRGANALHAQFTKASVLGEPFTIAVSLRGLTPGWVLAGPSRPQGESLPSVYTAIIWKQWN
jgi:hypothetical protein